MGKQFRPGWIGSLTESGTGNWCLSLFALSPGVLCHRRAPKFPNIDLCNAMAYGTTPSEQASTASCPGPSYVPQVPSHDREPQSSVQLACFLPSGHKEHGDVPRNALLVFFAFHGFATLLPRFAPSGTNNNLTSSTARGRKGIPSRKLT